MAKAKKTKQKTTRAKYAHWLTEEGLTKLEAWARDGLTDEQISHNMGVARATLAKYKTLYPAIDEALKKGKEVVDIQVENALLKKALGFKEKINKAFKVKTVKFEGGKRVETEEIVYAEDEVYVPPDTGAICFWLKNRKPKQWRDKQDIEHSGHLAVTIVDDVE